MDIMKGNSMSMRKFAAAAGFACGAVLAFAPLAAADASSDAASTVDGLLSGVSPAAATPVNIDISFDGYSIYDGGGSATATTESGEYGLVIAYGAHATATAEGGTGDYALASGTDANAEAGSLTTGATGNNYDSAVDIGSNTGAAPPAPMAPWPATATCMGWAARAAAMTTPTTSATTSARTTAPPLSAVTATTPACPVTPSPRPRP